MMNDWEVRSFCERAQRVPELVRYARFLLAWMDSVNGNSDGWAYWNGGRKAGEKIGALLQAALDGREVRPAEWNRAIGGVKRAASGQRKYGNRIPVPELGETGSETCTNGGEHQPNVRSIQPVWGEWIVDVWCQVCGRSGSIALSAEEIQW